MRTIKKLTEEELLPNDRMELRKFRKVLDMRRTKRGRWFLNNQKYWREYLGLTGMNVAEDKIEAMEAERK